MPANAVKPELTVCDCRQGSALLDSTSGGNMAVSELSFSKIIYFIASLLICFGCAR